MKNAAAYLRAVFTGVGAGVVTGVALHSLAAGLFASMAAAAFTQAVDRRETP